MASLLDAIIRSFANPATRLGRGGNAVVHAIEGFPEYVVRVPNVGRGIGNVLEPLPDPFGGRNFGQPVMRVGDATINKFQPGTPAGLTFPRDVPNPDDVYREAVELAAGMPQSAYDQFADDLRFVNDRGYQFDPSKSNNVLIDRLAQRFNLVDITPSSRHVPKSDLGHMVIPLAGNTYAWKYKGPNIADAYREILSKARQTGMPERPDDSSLKYTMQLAGLIPRD